MPVYRLNKEIVFPPPQHAEDGLLAVGGDLSVERLLLAYRMGIFPWYSEGDPILWWSPDPRMVLIPEEVHVSRSLARTLRTGAFQLTLDTAFPEVIAACATVPRGDEDGTWITRKMKAAYIALHDAGYAHSIECWKDGTLAGGLYGVSLGGCFFGESMFSRQPNASKVALTWLARLCASWGFRMIDCQVENPHLVRMGAREIPRGTFLSMLVEGLRTETRRGCWQSEWLYALTDFPAPSEYRE